MKIARIISLAAIAALACIALAGASSAFASETVLCKASSSYCSEANIYSSGTSLKAAPDTGTKTVIATSSGTFECSEGSLEGKTTAAKGNPLPVEATAWTLTKCRVGVTSCPAPSTQNLPYSASFTHGEAGNGSLALTGSGGSEVGWHVTCGTLIDCTLTFNPTLTVKGGNPAHLSIAQQAMQESGSNCPTESLISPSWRPVSYTFSAPQPLYVLQPPPPSGTVFCKTNTTPCLESDMYPSNTEVSAELASGTWAELATGIGTYKCSTSTFTGETTAKTGEPLPASIGSFTLGGCKLSGFACTVYSENRPYSTTFEVPEFGAKTMKLKGLKLFWTGGNCGLNCTFSAAVAEFTVTGGSPATLEINQELKREGTLCTSSSVFKATYQIKAPSPLYLIRNP